MYLAEPAKDYVEAALVTVLQIHQDMPEVALARPIDHRH